jgi:hypothetical protein
MFLHWISEIVHRQSSADCMKHQVCLFSSLLSVQTGRPLTHDHHFTKPYPPGKFQDSYAYLLAAGTTMHISSPTPLAHTAPSLSDEPILRRFCVQRVRMPRQRSISNTPANFDPILDPSPPLVNERKFSHPENMHVS